MITIRFIYLSLFFVTSSFNYLAGQDNRRSIAWTSFSAEVSRKKFSAFCEVENSRLLYPPRQDYLTVLTNFDISRNNINTGAGISLWLLYHNKGKGVPEFRPHFQIGWEQNKSKYSILNRVRFENRFIRDTLNNEILATYHYSLRPRVISQVGYYIYGKQNEVKSLQCVLYEEILVNLRNNSIFFSENRIYAGFWYRIFKTTSIRLGYVWVYSKDRNINNSDVIYLTIKKDFRP